MERSSQLSFPPLLKLDLCEAHIKLVSICMHTCSSVCSVCICVCWGMCMCGDQRLISDLWFFFFFVFSLQHLFITRHLLIKLDWPTIEHQSSACCHLSSASITDVYHHSPFMCPQLYYQGRFSFGSLRKWVHFVAHVNMQFGTQRRLPTCGHPSSCFQVLGLQAWASIPGISCLCLFLHMVLLGRPGWPWTHCFSASASQVLKLYTCITTPQRQCFP